MLDLQDAGSHVFDYGNNLRTEARDAGLEHAFDFPGLRAGLRPAALLPGRGPVPVGGALGRSRPTSTASTAALLEAFPDDVLLQRWLRLAPDRIAFQGLPARICWLGYGDRARAGLLFNDLVRRGEVSAPIVIGRDHLDTGSVASPFRETEAMKDGSDAIADWPILNALLSTVVGRVVGVGAPRRRRRDRQLDPRRARRSSPTAPTRWTSGSTRVLTNDPGIGVARHADAGYAEAIDAAARAAASTCRWRIAVSERDSGAHGRDRRLGAGGPRPLRRARAGTSP